MSQPTYAAQQTWTSAASDRESSPTGPILVALLNRQLMIEGAGMRSPLRCFTQKFRDKKQESCWCSCRYLELSPTSFQNAFSMIGQTRRAECRTRTNPAIQIPSSMA